MKQEGGRRTRGQIRNADGADPLVSVITVVFNGEQFLEQTIKSVLNQGYTRIEYLIIDGGSTDGTIEIIKEYEGDIDYWVSERDGGIYDAMNRGISLASGVLIGILNSDDWYEAGAVEHVVEAYRRVRGGIIHGRLRNLTSDGHAFILDGKKMQQKNFRRMVENHPTMFVASSVYQRVGMFDLRYPSISDWDFVMRCHEERVEFTWVNMVLTNFRTGGESSQLSVSRIKEKRKLRRNHGDYWAQLRYYNDLMRLAVVWMLQLSGLRPAYRRLKNRSAQVKSD